MLFQSLFRENFFNLVTEFSPPDMLTFLWRFEVSCQEIELSRADNDFSHTQSNPKLSVCDITSP